jgi:hypothetical protein
LLHIEELHDYLTTGNKEIFPWSSATHRIEFLYHFCTLGAAASLMFVSPENVTSSYQCSKIVCCAEGKPAVGEMTCACKRGYYLKDGVCEVAAVQNTSAGPSSA